MKSRAPKIPYTASARPIPSTQTTSVDARQAPIAAAPRISPLAGAPSGPGMPLTPATVLRLQRTLGNQATSALLKPTFTGSRSSYRLQRSVETFQADKDKVMYFSTYGRALHELENPLFETREQAEKYDEEMRVQWELRQKGVSSETMKDMPVGDHTKVPDKDSPLESSTTKMSDLSVGSSPPSTVPEPAEVPISQGLIHGTYKRATNSVDLHVNSKGGGEGLSIQDMLRVTQTLYRLMKGRSGEIGAPRGSFILHPTGAAIVKIVVQTLGEALGTATGIQQARALIAKRKVWEKVQFWKTKSMSTEKLDPSVIGEHVAYLQAIAGLPGVGIVPILAASITKATTPEEFLQNMLENTVAGRTRLGLYEETLQAQEVAVSLDVSLTEDQLPQIIALLSTYAAPKEQ